MPPSSGPTGCQPTATLRSASCCSSDLLRPGEAAAPLISSPPISGMDHPARSSGDARRAAVISSPDLGVFAVTAAGVLCAFGCLLDALPEHCLRGMSGVNPLVVAIFRI